jgi:hypothetical protein
VDGPPLWTFMITRGSSVITARPIASDLSARPGPDVEVTARFPAKLAPIDVHMPAISSSAWKLLTPRSFLAESSSRIPVAGVMGYEPIKSCSPAFSAAARKPHAVAVFPEIFL